MPSFEVSVQNASERIRRRREQAPDIAWIRETEMPVHFGLSSHAYHVATELDPEGHELPASETPDGVPGRIHTSEWFLDTAQTTSRRYVYILLENKRTSSGANIGSILWQQVTEFDENDAPEPDVVEWARLGYLAEYEHNGATLVDRGVSYAPQEEQAGSLGTEPALPSDGEGFAKVDEMVKRIHMMGIGVMERPQ